MRLQQRVTGILSSPRSEWETIRSEDDDVGGIYRQYIAVLAAIPAISILIGLAISGGRFLGTAGVATAVTAAVVSYVMALAAPIALAVVIEKLSPTFKADADLVQALKVVAYASTPIWLAGVSSMAIGLSPLVVVGWVWAIYLYYLGLPIVLKTPHEQVVPFMLVSVLAMLVVNIVIRAIVSTVNIPYY